MILCNQRERDESTTSTESEGRMAIRRRDRPEDAARARAYTADIARLVFFVTRRGLVVKFPIRVGLELMTEEPWFWVCVNFYFFPIGETMRAIYISNVLSIYILFHPPRVDIVPARAIAFGKGGSKKTMMI